MNKLTPKERFSLIRIGSALLLSISLLIYYRLQGIDESEIFSLFNLSGERLGLLFCALLIYGWIGYVVILKALHNIRHGVIFDESFLMTIATIGAFLIGEYSEAIAVMLFYQIGEFFQNYAVNKSRKSIGELLNIFPEYANLWRNGEYQKVDPYEVNVHDQIVVLAGERVPLDGVIISGHSSLNTAALTGESMPQFVEKGDLVYSGSINQQGRLIIEVLKDYENSTVSRILELVENATDHKSKVEVFSTTFARYYTPIVVFSALAIVLIPVLFFNLDPAVWLRRALVFLVVSCPCALVVSIPLTFFCGIGAASKRGILVKGSNYLEYLATVKTMIFDKTGTLTHGSFKVQKMVAYHGTETELLEKAAFAELHSKHPIAESIINAYIGLDRDLSDPKQRLDKIKSNEIKDVREIPGKGLILSLADKTLLCGNRSLLSDQGISLPQVKDTGTLIYLAEDGIFLGYLQIADTIKSDAAESIKQLTQLGVKECLMLTGDRAEIAGSIAEELGLSHFEAELFPDEKFAKVQQYLEEFRDKKHLLAFVGDGINDAPALALADVGIAMGGLGSDAAIEAADIVLLKDRLSSIVEAVQISKKTLAIARQNIFFSLAVKVGIMILATFGIANLWLAVFGDVGVTILAVANAMRTFFNHQ